jgi:hypothetical protein
LASGITIYHQNEKGFTLPAVLRSIFDYCKGRSKILFMGWRIKAASAKMIDESTDNLPVIPAISVEEIKNRLRPFVEAGVDRLIVAYVPVMEPVIDDAHRFVESWGKL